MVTKLTLFAQITQTLSRNSFKKLVDKYKTDKHNKGIDSWTHLITMLFCQFSKLNSLRDVTNGLKSVSGNLNHLGLRTSPSKSSLSYQNKHRDWHIFKDYYFSLLGQLSDIAKFRQTKFRFKAKILLLDSTTISLCLSLFDWAKYRKRKGAIKLHTLLDFDGCLPVYINLTDGNVNDAKAAKEIVLPTDSVVVADRAYIDFENLYRWDAGKSFFVVRSKKSIKYKSLKRNKSPKDKHKNIQIDEYVELAEVNTKAKYPKRLRRVVVWDDINEQFITLITNQFTWTANTISELYKSRWSIEQFFKDVKQLLKIKSFLGTSTNAVLIQIWTAMITILILKYLKACAKYPWCLSNLVAFLRLNLLVKFDLTQLLNNPFEHPPNNPKPEYIQGKLFDWGD